MMKLNKDTAFKLLTEGLCDPMSIQYVTHCFYVGELAGLIAEGIGADVEFATVLGYLHDIGRKIDNADHQYAGYLYLKENGYGEYADVCLIHSFLDNDIKCTAGIPFPTDHPEYSFIAEFVKEHKNTVYDKIVQTCDLLCTHEGGKTLEARLRDIESRKGRYDTAQYHYDTAAKQLSEFDKMLGHPVYDFYGELQQR